MEATITSLVTKISVVIRKLVLTLLTTIIVVSRVTLATQVHRHFW